MSEPPQDGHADETANVESFGEVSEIEAQVPGGVGVRVKGMGSLAYVARVAFPPIFALVGLGGAASILAAGRSFWAASVIFVVGIVLAVISRRMKAPHDPSS